jgi:hypothetical protein
MKKIEKLVVPKKPYINEIPYNKKPEAIEPYIKYFKPASIDKFEYFLKAAKIYNDRLCNSKAKYIINRSLTDKIINIPSILNKKIKGNSMLKKFSYFK